MWAMEMFPYHRNKRSDFPHRSLFFLTLNFLADGSLADQRKTDSDKDFPGYSGGSDFMTFRLRLLVLFVSSLIFSSASFARSSSTTTTKSKSTGNVTENARAQKRMARLRHNRAAKSIKRRHVHSRARHHRKRSLHHGCSFYHRKRHSRKSIRH